MEGRHAAVAKPHSGVEEAVGGSSRRELARIHHVQDKHLEGEVLRVTQNMSWEKRKKQLLLILFDVGIYFKLNIKREVNNFFQRGKSFEFSDILQPNILPPDVSPSDVLPSDFLPPDFLPPDFLPLDFLPP